MDIFGNRALEKMSLLISLMEKNSSRLQSLTENTEQQFSHINARIEELAGIQSAMLERISLLEVAAERIEEKSDNSLNAFESEAKALKKSADALSSGIKKFSRTSADVMTAVKETISQNTDTFAETSEALTQLCCETISEYNREVDESIRLILANSITSAIPKKE